MGNSCLAAQNDTSSAVVEMPKASTQQHEPRRLHQRARSTANKEYVGNRLSVPDSLVPWEVEWSSYAPIEWTHPSVLKQPVWADLADPSQIVGLRLRLSHEISPLLINRAGRPMNPMGRTGTSGRGLLGKWGPNQAADPMVVRAIPIAGAPANYRYQLVAIQRKDSGQWAFPGGMVDDGEHVSQTLRREFTEEAAALPDKESQAAVERQLDQIFGSGGQDTSILVYQGYVDDPRNTDNAWMETCVRLFLLDEHLGAQLALASGSDAAGVRWLDLDESLLSGEGTDLYADHLRFLQMGMPHVMKAHAAQRAAALTSR